MSGRRKAISTEMGYSTPDRIIVRGHDLPGELLGRIHLGDMAFLELMGRMPSSQESILFNALAVTLVEHGLTPSALAARLTYTGAPESIQAAVAAGLSGLGSVFVGTTEGSARLLQEAIPDARHPPSDLPAVAARIVAEWHARKGVIPGIGHPLHKPVDPRTPRLFALAAENGFDGPYIALMNRSPRRPHGCTARSCRSTPPARSAPAAPSSAFRGAPAAVSAFLHGRSGWWGISWRRCAALSPANCGRGLRMRRANMHWRVATATEAPPSAHPASAAPAWLIRGPERCRDPLAGARACRNCGKRAGELKCLVVRACDARRAVQARSATDLPRAALRLIVPAAKLPNVC